MFLQKAMNNDSNDSNVKIQTEEIQMKKINCINWYLNNKWIPKNSCFSGFAGCLLKYRSFLSLGNDKKCFANDTICWQS